MSNASAPKATAQVITTRQGEGSATVQGNAADEANAIDQVRAILFDGKFEEIAQRFEHLDKQLSQKTDDVLREVRDRLADLERGSTEREKLLRDALATLDRDGKADVAQLRTMLSQERESWQKKLAALNDELTRVRESKAGRTDLSSMLMDVAKRLENAQQDA